MDKLIKKVDDIDAKVDKINKNRYAKEQQAAAAEAAQA